MRRVPESEIENEFERDVAWGDDERHYYNPNRRRTSSVTFFLRLETVLKRVRALVPRGARIADFACGQGNYGLLLAEDGYDVTGVDIKAEFLKYARKKHTHGNFRTQLANIIEWRDPERFDAILLGEVIEHVAHPEQLLRSVAENLRPGGLAFVTTPNGAQVASPLPTYSQVPDVSALIPRQFHWGDHLFLYTEEELHGLLRAQGLEPLETIKYNSVYVSQIKAPRYLLPLRAIYWLDALTSRWKRRGRDSTDGMIVIARKSVN